MKRFILLGVVAVALGMCSEQNASAWTKFNFGVGFNVGCEGGNNSALFGMWKSGPTPGDCGYGGGCGGYGGAPTFYGTGAPAGYPIQPNFPIAPSAPMPGGKGVSSNEPQTVPGYGAIQPSGYYTYPVMWYGQ